MMLRRLSLPLVFLAGACTLQRSTPGGTPVTHSEPAATASSAPGATTRGPSADDHMAHMAAADLAAPVPGGVFRQDLSIPASNNGAPERLKASNRHSEWVKIASAPGATDSIMAWVVYPYSKTSTQKAPVVVVVHEIFGLSTWVRGVADQAAADGFIAIAPDFLSRVRGGPSSEELSSADARRLIAGVNAAEKNAVINAAANYAMMLPNATQKYAVIGYCWGGTAVWGHAVNGGVKGFSGGVAFYGAPYTKAGTPATATTPAVPATVDADSLAKIKAPVMLLNGSGDARIGALMPAIESTMKQLGKTYTGVNYEGAIHGFLRAQADPITPRDTTAAEAARVVNEPAANLKAAKDGWPKTIAFLRQVLK
ncbi:MAG: dienelactone hydrolase family protein [Gemmatimonadetes bacterium]|nr:dienelactone hydrolase family protein [Gemmatimonadota bacterium]